MQTITIGIYILEQEIYKYFIVILLVGCSPKEQPSLIYLQEVLGKSKILKTSSNTSELVYINKMIKESSFYDNLLSNIKFREFDYVLVNPFYSEEERKNDLLVFPDIRKSFIQDSNSYSYKNDYNKINLNIHYLTNNLKEDECYKSNRILMNSETSYDQWYELENGQYKVGMTFLYNPKNNLSKKEQKEQLYKLNKNIKSKKVDNFSNINFEKFHNLSKNEVYKKVKEYSSYRNLCISNIFIMKSKYNEMHILLENEKSAIVKLQEDNYHLQLIYYTIDIQKIIQNHTIR